MRRRRFPNAQLNLGDTLLDISQSHDRRAFSKEGRARTLTTSSRLFAFSQNRLLTPLEHMIMQGYSEGLVVPSTVSASAVRRMAGEGMALPCLATILLAILLLREGQAS